MGDTYQAVYDAARSRMSNGDIGDAVSSALREMNLSHYAQMAASAAQEAAYEHQRPSAIYRPHLLIDGNKWCALYGANLHEGVAGFGDTPAKAMLAFDIQWLNATPQTNGR